MTTEADQLLGISERQVRRLRSGYREQGVDALVHGTAVDPPATPSARKSCAGL